jgi:hypothetical protein
VGTNGIAMFIGAGTSADHAAHWVSHEIGHNLGLHHTAAGIENLMATSKKNSKLTNEQIAAVLQLQAREDAVAYIPIGGTGFPKLLQPILGDYNRNGGVDAGDFVLWRRTLNSRTNLAADGNNNGIVDSDDYTIWRRNFGNGVAGAALGTAQGGPLLTSGGIPEPASAILVFSGVALQLLGRRLRRAS